MRKTIPGIKNIYGPKQGFFDRLLKDFSHTYHEVKFYMQNGCKHKTLYFYPDYPSRKSSLFQIAHTLKYNVTNKRPKNISMVVYWDYNEERKVYDELQELEKTYPMLNYDCKDISKSFVDNVFKQVFGYQTKIDDPTLFQGKLVRKNEINAKHDGQIVEGPIEKTDPTFIYQRLLNNINEDGLSEELRIPYIKGEIPYVYIKYKNTKHRFRNVYEKVDVVSTDSVLSADECKKIQSFCTLLGLDFGELDAIRDRSENGKFYIIDANNTPNAALTNLPKKRRKELIQKQAQLFDKSFLQ